jgi:ATP-binding cassette subfamily C protein EexD
LARALYGNPAIIVLDEPNSNLDEQGEVALGNTINRLKKENATVVVVTHRNNVLAHVDKLLILNDGILTVYGPKDQVIAHLQKQAAATKEGMPPQSSEASSNTSV